MLNVETLDTIKADMIVLCGLEDDIITGKNIECLSSKSSGYILVYGYSWLPKCGTW
jgi:hypothetical protein